MDKKQTTLERINNIVIPSDLQSINIGYIPLGKEVVLQKIKHGERKTQGGLLLAESAQASSPVARIVAVGPECSDYIKLGLLVRFNPMMNTEEVVNGVNYIFVDEYAVRGIIEDETKTVFHDKFPTSDDIRRKDAKDLVKRSREITAERVANIEEKFSKPAKKR